MYEGAEVRRLEEELQTFHQVKHALTCGSGTFGIELALRGLGVGLGDEVILSAYDYPGNFLSIHAVGAHPVLVDIAPHNWNLAPELLARAVTPATRAILVSHLHGGVVPMREVMNVAACKGLFVIEDACQCPGALIEGRRAGTWGHVGVLSFGGSKLLTAGRGGAVLTPGDDIYQRMRTANLRGNVVCPLSELQAAVLRPQLAKLDERNRQRAAAVARLAKLLADVPGLRMFCRGNDPSAEPQAGSSPFPAKEPTLPGYYKLGFQYDAEAFGLSRRQFVLALRAEGIAFDEGFRSLHVGRSPKRFRAGSELTEASRAHENVVVLHHPVLLGSEEDLQEIRLALLKVRVHADQLRTFLGHP